MSSQRSSNLPEFDCWVAEDGDEPVGIRAVDAQDAAADRAEKLDQSSGGAMSAGDWNPVIHVRAPDDTVTSWSIEVEFSPHYHAWKAA
jgi:hypothetical protein